MFIGPRGKLDAEVVRQVSNLQLTERLNDTKLSSWIATLHGQKARQALRALADASVFFPPPQPTSFQIFRDRTSRSSSASHR
jgi:hypothetical protein